MKRTYKPCKKTVISYIALLSFLIVFLPLAAAAIFPGISLHLPDSENSSIEIPRQVKVYRTETDTFEKMNLEDYVAGVVASEMPERFETEALKAQAVASRTYALGRIQAGRRLCDSVHCQAFRDYNISRKVRKAVKATCGQVLTYEGRLAASALYFSSSGGATENSEDVFVSPVPYLVSVASDYEPGATHKDENTVMKISAFSAAVRKAFPDLEFGEISQENIAVLSHSSGGRVSRIKIGRQILSGSDVRKALALSSTRFSVGFDKGKIVIVSDGCGHGVGMSQYGANGMAKKGKDFREILAHYYKGTKVSRGRQG